MNYTNLNIKSSDKTFKYIVEYGNNLNITSNILKYYWNDSAYFFFDNEHKNVLHQKNYWLDVKEESTYTSNYIPNNYKTCYFDLFFPRYSVETYNRNVYYVLTMNTWINDKCIYLGSYLIDRKQAIAPENGIRKFLNDEYYEYIRVNTVDPFSIIYDDMWKDFRVHFCGEKVFYDGVQKNNSASNINVTLTPVKLVDNIWIKLDGYDSSQSVLQIDNSNDTNYLTNILKFDIEEGNPIFNCKLSFNEVYQNNFKEYLLETYQITIDENFKIKYCFVIGDKENPYKYKEHIFEKAETSDKFILDEFAFNSWNEYEDGLYAWCFVIIQKHDEDILVITSNRVFITKEIFKYLMNEDIRKVDLQNIDMEIKKYDVVNIIKNEIVSVERPTDYKANIIKPVFVKVQETESIRLHRSVTESICINLDAYKNKVDAFVLKVGDTNFYETGRINSGVVFKVFGTNLPETDGIYYILNNEGELVTTGNYTIV